METNWIKKKKIFSKLWFFLVFIFLLIIIPAVLLTFWFEQGLAAPVSSGKEKIFIIKPEESTISIANRLKDEGLIRDATIFRIYTRINCKGIKLTNPNTWFKSYSSSDCLSGHIQAGSFKLSPTMDLAKVSQTLTKGRLDSWIRLVEGLRNEEIADKLAKQYPFSAEDFLKVAKIGYMFPDTYLFKVNSTAAEISQEMQTNFSKKFTADLAAKAKNQGLSSDEAVILASIVQREAGNEEDAPLIASVFYNRLNNGMPLGSDVTIQFALGYDQTTKTWWKKELLDQDLTIDSPYNTRKFAGLPPGPICNPGLTALKAVAEPAESDYFYFLYGKEGKVHFARTLTEHNANKLKYL